MISLLPKNKRLELALRELIETGPYRPHDRFMSVAKLKDEFNASQATVIQALEKLEAEGMIYRKNRSGIFISPTCKTRQILIVSGGNRATSHELNLFSYGLGESPEACLSGYVVINTTEKDFEANVENLGIVYKSLHAVVFFRCPETIRKHHALLESKNIFHIFYGSSAAEARLKNLCRYCYDENKLVSMGMEALYEQGHRRIACFSSQLPVFKERANCYVGWMQEKGLPAPDIFFLEDDEDGYGYMMKKLPAGSLPYTAFFCTSNQNMGTGLLQALKDKGFQAPGDAAIIGIADIPAGRMLRPALASVEIDYQRDSSQLLKFFDSPEMNLRNRKRIGESSFIFNPGGTI